MSQRTRKLLWAAVFSIGTITTDSLGQTWIATNGSWSDDTKWSTPPAPSPATSLMFPMFGSGTLAYTSTNDLPGPFTLHDINVQGVAGGSLIIGAGGSASLRFDGPLANVNVSTGGSVLVNARSNVVFALPLALNPAPGGTLTFAGVMRAPFGLSISGSNSAVSLLSENRIGQPVNVLSTTLNLGSVDSLGSAVLSVTNAMLTLGSSTFATQPNRAPFIRNNIITAANGLRLGDHRSFTLTGDISGSGGITVAPSSLSTGTWTLAGNNSFNGPVTVNQAPGSVSPILNMLAFAGPAAIGNTTQFNLNGAGAAIGFLGGMTPYTVNQPLAINGGGAVGVFDNGTRADVTYGGDISGNTGLSRVGGGVMTLSGANGFIGGLTVGGTGFTVAASDTQLGNAGGTITLAGGGLLLENGFSLLAPRTLIASLPAGTLHTEGDVAWGGAILNNGVIPGGFVKEGPGNLLVTSNSNSVGSLVINAGRITAGGASGRITATGSLAVNQGAALVIDHSLANVLRISPTAPMSLRGGTLRVIGNATSNSSVTSTGQLALGSTFNSGQGLNVIEVVPGASANTAVRFGSLNRTQNNGMQTLFTGAGLGEAPIGSLAVGKANISFTTAPATVNGILPFAVMDRGFGKELASYTAGNGIVEATYTSTTLNNGTVATHNVAVGSETIAAAGTINAAKFTGGTVDLTAGTLTVTSGAMLFTGPTLLTGGTLVVGTATTNTTTAPTANLFVYADTEIASRFSILQPQNGLLSGIAKGGPGVLTLSNPANQTRGPTRILEGTLRLGNNNILPNEGGGVIINPGATFDMNGFNDTIGSIGQVSPINEVGSYQTGTVIIGAASLATGADSSSTSINLNILGTGTLVKAGAGTMTITGDQSFSGVMAIANGTIALGTHFTTGTGMRNVNRINVGTSGSNAEVGLRFEYGLRSFDRPIFVAAQPGRTATLAFADNLSVDFASPITLTNAQGLVIDAAGGPNLIGSISGVGFPLTTVTSGISQPSSRTYSLRLGAANTYSGITTLAADTTVWGDSLAFGSGISAVQLGSTAGDDMPEISGDVGGLTLTRGITVNGSISSVPIQALISSRVPTGGGTVTYAGVTSIAGSRSKLILFSTGEPLVMSNLIVGSTPAANLQIGHAFDELDVTTRSNVILSGASSFAGGVTLAAGTLGINGVSSVVLPAPVTGAPGTFSLASIISSPLGTGTLTIGVSTIAVGHEPTLVAIGAPRAIFNPVEVTRNFFVSGAQRLTLNGTFDLNDAARIVTVESALTVNGGLLGDSNSALVKDGAGPMTIGSANTFAGSVVAAEGSLTLAASQDLGGIFHVGPAAKAIIATGANRVVGASAITVDAANGGQLDVGDGGGIVDYSSASPLGEIAALIASGFNGANWSGNGINSSLAAAQTNTAVGVIEAADIGATSFLGQSFDGDAVLFRYTLYGDNDLNGMVDLGDFALMAINFNAAGRWYSGDYDFSGVTDIGDFALMAANFNQGLPAAPARSSVPEPGFGAVVLLATALGRRSPRRRRK